MEIQQARTETSPLASVIGSIAAMIDGPLSPGDVAALRRLQPGAADCAAFWRLISMHPGMIPHDGPGSDEAERRWGCILQAMATLAGQHRPAVPLGRALAEAAVSEPRVLRLLRASGDNLADMIRVTARHLAQKAIPVNQIDLAALVLSDGGSNEDAVRRRIARTYFASQAKES